MDVLGVIVGTRPRGGADAASGDPTPTASGDREQDFPDWLQPFTEGQAKGESESSGSAGGKQFPKHLVHISQRDPRTNLAGNTFDSVIFRRTPIEIHAKRTKITRDPCRRNPESREDRIPQATKFWGYTYSRSQSSQCRERIASASSICGSGGRWAFSNGYKVILAETRLHKIIEKVAAVATSRKQAWSDLH